MSRTTYRTRDFLIAIPERVRPLLPDDLRQFESVQRWSLVKLWYRNPRIHYEAWIHGRIGRLEIGLHFEADRDTNARLLEHVEHDLIVVKAVVSERFEAEPWDKGWTRLYESILLRPLDEAFLDEAAARMARLIEAVEPLLPSDLS